MHISNINAPYQNVFPDNNKNVCALHSPLNVTRTLTHENFSLCICALRLLRYTQLFFHCSQQQRITSACSPRTSSEHTTLVRDVVAFGTFPQCVDALCIPYSRRYSLAAGVVCLII